MRFKTFYGNINKVINRLNFHIAGFLLCEDPLIRSNIPKYRTEDDNCRTSATQSNVPGNVLLRQQYMPSADPSDFMGRIFFFSNPKDRQNFCDMSVKALNEHECKQYQESSRLKFSHATNNRTFRKSPAYEEAIDHLSVQDEDNEIE